jgi:hypothetical protein
MRHQLRTYAQRLLHAFAESVKYSPLWRCNHFS